MTDALFDFHKSFLIDQLKIAENDSWILSTRPKQITLGCSVISIKRECTSLSDITPDEALKLNQIIKTAEFLTSKTFNHNKTNLLGLMMKDPLVHFHFIPRYKNAIIFDSNSWIDKEWPNPPSLTNPKNITKEELLSIRNALLKNT